MSGNYNAYVGNRQGLQFPVMCDAYITIPFNKNITTENTPYGIWEHEGNFTFESIITPYDVNGYGIRTTQSTASEGILTSQKTFSAIAEEDINSGQLSQDELYLPLLNRTSHKMMLFHSDNFKLYLQNTTLHNHNQPAEYKIVS